MTRRTRAVLIAGVALALMIPAMAGASHRFTDVPDTNAFHDNISWLADAGVTLGCNPPTNDLFCPGANVSRQQMAAFMARFAQYIDAVDGTPGQADNATTADSATTAGDADTVDGEHAADLKSAATGTFRDGLNGGDVLTITVGTRTELGSITVAEADGAYAVVTYSLYGGAAADVTVFVWLQRDNTTCNENGSDRIAGSLTVSNIANGDFGSLASSLTTDTTGSPVLTLCVLSNGGGLGMRDFQLNAVQVSEGSAPIQVDGAASPSGTADSNS